MNENLSFNVFEAERISIGVDFFSCVAKSTNRIQRNTSQMLHLSGERERVS